MPVFLQVLSCNFFLPQFLYILCGFGKYVYICMYMIYWPVYYYHRSIYAKFFFLTYMDICSHRNVLVFNLQLFLFFIYLSIACIAHLYDLEVLQPYKLLT